MAMVERKFPADGEDRPRVGLHELAAEHGLGRLRRDTEWPRVLDAPDHPAQIVERAGAGPRVSR
jgi:hypothetical protein